MEGTSTLPVLDKLAQHFRQLIGYIGHYIVTGFGNHFEEGTRDRLLCNKKMSLVNG